MNSMIKVAIVRSIVSANKRQVLIDEKEVAVGDVVLVGRTNDELFGSFDVGRVEDINEVGKLYFTGETNVVIKDVITDASPIFKAFKQKLRKQEIKKEIKERMLKVDEEKKMEMYADSDEEIADLLKELKNLKE